MHDFYYVLATKDQNWFLGLNDGGEVNLYSISEYDYAFRFYREIDAERFLKFYISNKEKWKVDPGLIVTFIDE